MNGLFNLIFDYFDGFEKFLKVVKRKKWTMQVLIKNDKARFISLFVKFC